MQKLLRPGDYRHSDPRIRIHRRGKVANFARCPARYHAEETTPGEESDPLIRGTSFHDAVEAALKPLVGRTGMPNAEAGAWAIDLAPSHLQAELTELFRNWLGNYVPEPILGVEKLLSSKLIDSSESPDGLEHHVGGRLDLVTALQVVWDWKTSWAIPSDDELRRDLQPAAYAVMASDRYGWSHVTVAVQFVRWNATRVVEYDLADLELAGSVLKARVLELLRWEAERADADPNERRPGTHCVGCPLLRSCDVASPSAIETDDDAAAVGASLAQLEIRGKHLKTILRTYLENRETRDCALEGGGRLWSLGLKGTREVRDVELLATRLTESGFNPFAFVRADMDKLKSLLKKHPEMADTIEPLIDDRRRTSLRSEKL